MTGDEVRQRTNELTNSLETTTDVEELRTIADDLVPLFVDYWDVHPHSAMEMLEFATFRLPVRIAHALVASVVAGWRENRSYDPTAGGNADHCYLSALILSDNYALAEPEWLATDVLHKTLRKEIEYPRYDRMVEGAERKAIVDRIADAVGYRP